jgi:NTE family protein
MQADLVLEGGGVKGIALAGAVSVLEERGYEFARIAGTSAGAIVGALLAAGVPGKELADIIQDGMDYRRFRDPTLLSRLGPAGMAASLVWSKGVYAGDYLRLWLGEHLAPRGVRTFGDLRRDDRESALPRDQDYRLVVVASDISRGRLALLPWDCRDPYEQEPDEMEVAEAVRASMAIPFYFSPLRYPGAAAGQSWLVDGGMLSNFPVWVFDRGDGKTPRWPTFGIKLSSRAEAVRPYRKVRSLAGMGHAMVATMMSAHDRMHIDREDVAARTIFVDTFGISPIAFDIGPQDQQRLFDSGRAAAEKFLDGEPGSPGWDFGAYVERFPGSSRQPAED